MTAGDWQPFGGDPAPGDPWAAGVLAATFGNIAETGRRALSTLHGVANSSDGSVWRGPSADAFHSHLAQTPGQLQQMVTSHETASQAMAAFSASLSGYQDQAAAILPRLWAALDDVNSAQAARNALPAGHPTTAADDQVAQTTAYYHSLLGQAADIRSGVQAAAARAQAGLTKGQSQGIQNESWWQHFLDDSSAVLGEVAKWGGVVLVVIAIVVLLVAFPEITGPLLAFFAEAGEALLAGLAATGEAFGGFALEAGGEALVEEGGTEVAAEVSADAAGDAGADAAGDAGAEAGEDTEQSVGGRLADAWKELGENNYWKAGSWALRGVLGLKTAVDMDRVVQYGGSDAAGDLAGDGIEDVLGSLDVLGDVPGLGAKLGLAQDVATETKWVPTFARIFSPDGEAVAEYVTDVGHVTTVSLNRPGLVEPFVQVANAFDHGSDWLGKGLADLFGGGDGGENAAPGVTHHVSYGRGG